MRDQQYELETAESFMSYEFISKGPKGDIVKLVKYTEINDKGFYNLGFGDKIKNEDDYNDTVISDNQDSVRVLATVAATTYSFTNHFPDAKIFAEGSNEARTRLYRIGISNNLEEIEKDFAVLGLFNGKWERFVRNKNYSAFLIKRNKDYEKK
jgi:hypothetical protein